MSVHIESDVDRIVRVLYIIAEKLEEINESIQEKEMPGTSITVTRGRVARMRGKSLNPRATRTLRRKPEPEPEGGVN